MTTALTLFILSKVSGGELAFCYGVAREVRGSELYSRLALPRERQERAPMRLPINGHKDIELVTYDGFLNGTEEVHFRQSFESGQLSTPHSWPGDFNQLNGTLCTEIIIDEGNNWVRCSGTGLLLCQTIAVPDALNELLRKLVSWIGHGNAADALQKILSQIDVAVGWHGRLKKNRSLGQIDRLYRSEPDPRFYGPLLSVRLDKPDFRTHAPMNRCYVTRNAAPLERAFQLHVKIANYDDALSDHLISLPAAQAEVALDVATHITDLTIEAFDPNGSLVHRQTLQCAQSFEFGIAAEGQTDILPKVKGTASAPDLERRARLSTVAFTGPSAGERSGGLDLIRRNKRRLTSLFNAEGWSAETRWFDRSGEGQLAVIRWLKDKIETPGVVKAYLVDPYLGSDALQRVIVRQGNLGIDFSVLVSPGRFDPEDDQLDAVATTSHTNKLVETATELAKQLCGKITLYHVRRGDDRKQAFHDRYFLTVNQAGIPTAYLLSNSLNKAAGDWPYSICEADRTTSWRVREYIDGLLAGEDGDRTLETVLLWTSPGDMSGIPTTSPAPAGNALTWQDETKAFVQALLSAVLTNARAIPFDGIVACFVPPWPAGHELANLAVLIQDRLGYRPQNLARISAALRNHGGERERLADALDPLLADAFFTEFDREDWENVSWLSIDGRDQLIRHIASVLARRPRPTNFVRDRINPIVEEMLFHIETQRFDSGVPFWLVQLVTCLTSMCLELALICDADDRSRTGIAKDYVNVVGRLFRSEASCTRLEFKRDGSDVFWRPDVEFLLSQLKAAHERFGQPLHAPFDLVLSDALVHDDIKASLRGFHHTQ